MELATSIKMAQEMSLLDKEKGLTGRALIIGKTQSDIHTYNGQLSNVNSKWKWWEKKSRRGS